MKKDLYLTDGKPDPNKHIADLNTNQMAGLDQLIEDMDAVVEEITLKTDVYQKLRYKQQGIRSRQVYALCALLFREGFLSADPTNFQGDEINYSRDVPTYDEDSRQL